MIKPLVFADVGDKFQGCQRAKLMVSQAASKIGGCWADAGVSASDVIEIFVLMLLSTAVGSAAMLAFIHVFIRSISPWR